MFQSSWYCLCFIKNVDGLWQGSWRKKLLNCKCSREIGSRRPTFAKCATNTPNPGWLLSSQRDPNGVIQKPVNVTVVKIRAWSKRSSGVSFIPFFTRRAIANLQASLTLCLNTSHAMIVRNNLFQKIQPCLDLSKLNVMLAKGGLVETGNTTLIAMWRWWREARTFAYSPEAT